VTWCVPGRRHGSAEQLLQAEKLWVLREGMLAGLRQGCERRASLTVRARWRECLSEDIVFGVCLLRGEGSMDKSRVYGLLMCVGAAVVGWIFLSGIARGSYWAVGVPVFVAVAGVCVLVFWIGLTKSPRPPVLRPVLQQNPRPPKRRIGSRAAVRGLPLSRTDPLTGLSAL